jgi:hypothetical protein
MSSYAPSTIFVIGGTGAQGMPIVRALVAEEGIKFFVYGNLDYALKKSGYDSRFRTGHYDGKGRIAEWVLFQNENNRDRMGTDRFSCASSSPDPAIRAVRPCTFRSRPLPPMPPLDSARPPQRCRCGIT